MLRQEHKTTREVAQELTNQGSATVKHNTIANVAHRNGLVSKKRPVKKELSEQNRLQRLRFAKWMLRNRSKWRSMLITDESTVLLSGSRSPMHTRQWYWREEAAEPLEKKNSSVRLHVWGGISRCGTLQLRFFAGKLNAQRYQNEILEHAIPEARKMFETHHIRHWTFQQDGASFHSAKTTIQWLDKNKISHISGGKQARIKWPANSPDLSVIENLWAIIKDRIYRTKPQSRQELEQAILAQWQLVDDALLKSLFDSMEDRLKECIEKRGGHTGY